MASAIAVHLRLGRSRIRTAADLRATVILTNTGPETVRLNTLFLEFPSIVLQVRDHANRRVPTGPPPVPPLDDGSSGREELPPGGQVSFDYRGGGLFGTQVSPGSYSIRFYFESVPGDPQREWAGVLQSEWIPFSITNPTGETAG